MGSATAETRADPKGMASDSEDGKFLFNSAHPSNKPLCRYVPEINMQNLPSEFHRAFCTDARLTGSSSVFLPTNLNARTRRHNAKRVGGSGALCFQQPVNICW